MNLNFYQPKNKILKKYIEGYYFISKDQNSTPVQYLTFPNNFCILTTNEDLDVEIQNNEVIIKSSPDKNIMTCVVSRYTKPMKIHYKELINEVTIYFKPLGINQFLTDPKSIFSEGTILDFTFMPDFNAKMIEIFTFARDRQIEELENYLLSKLKIKDFSVIEKILEDIESDAKIEEIALKHQISRQYLNKIFTKHIGKSPSEYRKIHRFRNSILKQQQSKNFSELSQYDFYDQSHFIRNFKELTDRNPQIFFKTIDTKKENVWLFI